jgi:hypothetical protein
MMRSIVISTVVACALAAPVLAATPDAGTLGSADGTVEWTGHFAETLTPGLPDQCPVQSDRTCDHFRLTVSLPAGYFADHPGSVEVAVRWVNESTDKDLDLFVFDAGGEQVGSSAGQDSSAEVAHLASLGNGTYDVYVVPVSLSEPRDYDGRVEVEASPITDPVGDGHDLLPDMTTLEPHTLAIATAEYLVDPRRNDEISCYPEEVLDEDENLPTRCLRFDQIAANFGEGPLELRYVPSVVENPELRQVIYRSDGTKREVAAETMEFHPVHGHWHYKGFGLGRLYDTAGTLVRSNHKRGFCLIEVDFEAWGEKGNSPRTKSYPGCQLPNDGEDVVQGIGVGWADVYNWFLADQFIDITGLADGVYRLEIVADPDNTLRESDETNNAHSTWVCIHGLEVKRASGPTAACPAS